jgi:uracil phosphoribosyltransferase
VLMKLKQDESPLGYDYTTETIAPSSITLVPILRSGLSMLEGTHPSIASLPFLTPRSFPTIN